MYKRLLFLVLLAPLSALHAQTTLFNNGWEFAKDIDSTFSDALLLKTGNVRWQQISLPHTANIEPVIKKAQQWQGICFYRKFFTVPATDKGKHIAIQFDAAMQEADVYLNGKHIFKHLGGYLPFYIDVSNDLLPGKENSLVVKLDNRDNALIPPGKPIKTLDFNYYSGIYRNAWLIVKNKLHISNAIAANKTAGGGISVHYEDITAKAATLVLKTEVANDLSGAQSARIKATLRDKTGKVMATLLTENQTIAGGSAASFTANAKITDPALWSPDAPNLYTLTVDVLSNGKVVDSEGLKTGVKKIKIDGGMLYVNDKKLTIRGTNRHQDYPWVGNAVSDNAQYRDAWKIKLAGFNFVRTSHYPQSPAFLSACDELGILVMDAIPGWQFVGNATFQENSFQTIRDMIHRDRNHASIVLWEASLNESNMKKDYMDKAHAIVHEELPFPGIYSAGWKNSVYDVFLPARQHGKAPDYWKKYKDPMPLLVAEYGDWEYYAQNAGFNQTEYKDLKAEERTSRQLRGSGEKRLLQQALNYQEAHNDNLYGADLGDVNWLMFDYNRGYADDIESSGIMDITRVPKFAFYFYQSQVDPLNTTPFNAPMLFIANYWQSGADTAVKIYSNCSEVELLLNGKSLGRQKPDADKYSTNLKHAPFSFHVAAYQPGTLTAIGYLNNKEVVRQQQQTAGTAAGIRLHADYSGKDLKAGQNDLLFVYADIVDSKGNVVYSSDLPLDFTVSADAELMGGNHAVAEAGTAGIVVKAGKTPGKIVITAKAAGVSGATLVLTAK